MNRRRDSRGRFAKAVAEVGLEEYKDEVGNYRGDNGGDNRDNRGGFYSDFNSRSWAWRASMISSISPFIAAVMLLRL